MSFKGNNLSSQSVTVKDRELVASNGPGNLKILFQCESDSYLTRQNY